MRCTTREKHERWLAIATFRYPLSLLNFSLVSFVHERNEKIRDSTEIEARYGVDVPTSAARVGSDIRAEWHHRTEQMLRNVFLEVAYQCIA